MVGLLLNCGSQRGNMAMPTRLTAIIILTLGLSVSHCYSQNSKSTNGGLPTSTGIVPPTPFQSATSPAEFRISVIRQPNPLLEVAKTVSQRFGVPIAYEEPAWIADIEMGRLIDLPDTQTRPPDIVAKMNPRLRAPALGSIELHETIVSGRSDFDQAGEILRDSVDEHGRRGNPGVFKVVRLGDLGYGIVPTNIRNASGQFVSALSPLDAPISFPAGNRRLGETLRLIAKAIGDATGQKINAQITAPGFNSIFDQAKSDAGAQNEVARNVLARVLHDITTMDGVKPKLWWTLEYAINGNSTNPFGAQIKDPVYNINFHIVTRTDPDGHAQIVRWP